MPPCDSYWILSMWNKIFPFFIVLPKRPNLDKLFFFFHNSRSCSKIFSHGKSVKLTQQWYCENSPIDLHWVVSLKHLKHASRSVAFGHIFPSTRWAQIRTSLMMDQKWHHRHRHRDVFLLSQLGFQHLRISIQCTTYKF